MEAGARTPEELETLLEDACVMHDGTAVEDLFFAGAVLASHDVEARGERIPALLTDMWASGLAFVAQPRRVLQATDTALVVSDTAISVMHRAHDRRWRYAIALLDTDPQSKGRHR